MSDSTFVLETFTEVLPRRGGTGTGQRGKSKYPFAGMPMGTRVRLSIVDPPNAKKGAGLRRVQQVAYGLKRADGAKFEIRLDPADNQYAYVYCVAPGPVTAEQAAAAAVVV